MITISLLSLIAIKAFNNKNTNQGSPSKPGLKLNFDFSKYLDLNPHKNTIGFLTNAYYAILYFSHRAIMLSNGKILRNKSLHIIHPYLITRLVSLILLFAGIINMNFTYINSTGSGLGLFSGLFYVNQTTLIIESVIYIVGALILLSFAKPAISGGVSHQQEHFCKNTASHAEKSKGVLGMESSMSANSAKRHLESDRFIFTDYSVVVLFSVLGTSLLISCNDLISIYLSIELQSFGLYVLSTLYNTSVFSNSKIQAEKSTGAGLKYFLLGGLSSCIILLGSGIVYSYTGLTNLELISSLNNVQIFHNQIQASSALAVDFHSNISNLGIVSNEDIENYKDLGTKLGFILIFVGLLFKIAAAPLHNWSPDVYSEVPTIITTWLTIIPKLSIIVLLLEICFQFNDFSSVFNMLMIMVEKTKDNTELSEFYNSILTIIETNTFFWSFEIQTILLVSSVLSLILGTVLGLKEIKIKRLLA